MQEEEKKEKPKYNYHFTMEDKEAELWWTFIGSRFGGCGDPDYSKWDYSVDMNKKGLKL